MMDLINREQAINIIDEIDTFCAGWRDYAISRIKALPSAKKTGKWLKGNMPTYGGYKCSMCEENSISKFNYCPNCGASMDLGE